MLSIVKQLDPEKKHYEFQVWEGELGNLEPISGEPWRGYDHACILSVDKDGVGEIRQAMSVPMGPRSVATCRKEGRKLGLKRLYFLRYIEPNIVPVEIPL